MCSKHRQERRFSEYCRLFEPSAHTKTMYQSIRVLSTADAADISSEISGRSQELDWSPEPSYDWSSDCGHWERGCHWRRPIKRRTNGWSCHRSHRQCCRNRTNKGCSGGVPVASTYECFHNWCSI